MLWLMSNFKCIFLNFGTNVLFSCTVGNMKYHLGDLVFLINGDCDGDGKSFENVYCGRIDAFLMKEHGQWRNLIFICFHMCSCSLNFNFGRRTDWFLYLSLKFFDLLLMKTKEIWKHANDSGKKKFFWNKPWLIDDFEKKITLLISSGERTTVHFVLDLLSS